MINKKIYAFLLIALLSFVSLSMFSSIGFVEGTSKSAIECVEKENNLEREIKVFSHLSSDLNFNMYKAKSHIAYKDKIYTLQIKNSLLRPPIFS